MVEGVDAGADAGGVVQSAVLQWLPGADHPEL